ncbi:hypothetical protein, partial [uncultured Microscilla sp.]|uniref:hypothetical protein n=1 Tax=uncultured Microscilla sp. TaxID=432653 RepID=UPI002618D130
AARSVCAGSLSRASCVHPRAHFARLLWLILFSSEEYCLYFWWRLVLLSGKFFALFFPELF